MVASKSSRLTSRLWNNQAQLNDQPQFRAAEHRVSPALPRSVPPCCRRPQSFPTAPFPQPLLRSVLRRSCKPPRLESESRSTSELESQSVVSDERVLGKLSFGRLG